MSLTDDIKDFALDLGYHAVGIAPAHPFHQFVTSFAERREDYLGYGYLSEWSDPQHVLPEARSIVVAIYDYASEGFPPELVGKIGRIYQARCHLAPPTRIHGARPELLRHFLESKNCRVAARPNGRSGVPDRQAAARAGVSQFGRNTFACAPSVGSFIMIHSFVTDAELDYDKPNEQLHCPPKCHICQEACPTGAIISDIRVNPRRCIAYNTFATCGGEAGVSPIIPKEIRPKMGAWIHGCDICQEVCPKNQARIKAKLPVSPYLIKKAAEFEVLSVLSMTDEYYARVVHPLMYNYIRDQSLFRRNAAIALGNTSDPQVVPALSETLNDPSEIVRAHVAWALGRIGGWKARSALETRVKKEGSELVQSEIKEALAR